MYRTLMSFLFPSLPSFALLPPSTLYSITAHSLGHMILTLSPIDQICLPLSPFLSLPRSKDPDLQAGNDTFQFVCLFISPSPPLLFSPPSPFSQVPICSPTPPGNHLSWWMSWSSHPGLP